MRLFVCGTLACWSRRQFIIRPNHYVIIGPKRISYNKAEWVCYNKAKRNLDSYNRSESQNTPCHGIIGPKMELLHSYNKAEIKLISYNKAEFLNIWKSWLQVEKSGFKQTGFKK